MDDLIAMFREMADRLEAEKPLIDELREAAFAVVDTEARNLPEYVAAFDRLRAAVAKIRSFDR